MILRLKDLPAEADTVIVGGGVAGTSIAYHLAKQVNKNYDLMSNLQCIAKVQVFFYFRMNPHFE